MIKGYVYSPDFTYMSLLVLISPLIICVLVASYLYITTIYLSHMLNTPKRERDDESVFFISSKDETKNTKEFKYVLYQKKRI